MAVNWTNEQSRAIDARGHSILVSAAAGSGKTAVLVERIIRRLCDRENPCDIDRFLIVTFTKAAASEMRGKISDALTEKLLENPDSRRLRTQLSRLHRADIMTVDSFCAKLLREFFQEAGISPDFRVCDDGEAAALQNEVIEELIEEKYEESESGSPFLELVDALSAARDDSRLSSVILECYRKIQSHPFPELWLNQNIENTALAGRSDPSENIYGKLMISALRDCAAYHARRLEDACGRIEKDDIIRPKYLPAFSQDLDRARVLLEICKSENAGWDKIRTALFSASEKMRLAGVRGYSDAGVLDELKAVRDGWHKALDGFSDGAFAEDAEKTRQICAGVEPVARALMETVRQFDAAYASSKRAKNILDFADLEHFALKVLIDNYGKDGFAPSGTARAVSSRFDEIAVDEFQDSNEVQDLIFRSLSRDESNLFFVGDVKQSIYGFRLADPSVFMDKYERAKDEPSDGESERIILSSNFRSRKEVIDSVNYIFSNILSPSLGGIAYAGREALVCGAQYPQREDDCESEFVLLEDGEDGRGSLERQADYVASRISGMLREGFPVTDKQTRQLRPCRSDDFAILLRSAQSRAPVYADALARAGVPVYTENTGSLFDCAEVMTLLSLCDVIDNPEQDVPLASVLHSPLFSFTADELAEIRICEKKLSFYTALKKAAEGEGGLARKCQSVLARFEALRSASREMNTDRFLIRVLQETDFFIRFGAAYGEEFSKERVNAFISAASRIESSGYRGFYSFLRQMHAIKDGNGIQSPSSEGNGVRIMTVHKSKGLEFPVVFMTSLETRFNMQDLTVPVLIHPALGAGFRLRPKGRMIEFPTLARHAVSAQLKKEQLSEQMRVLYVALTRAKEKLILVAAGEADSLVKKLFPLSAASPIPPQALEDFISPLPWLFAPLLRLPCAAEILQNAGVTRAPLEEDNRCWKITVDTPAAPEQTEKAEASDAPASVLPLSEEELFARFSFRYDPSAAFLPSKLTATGLKGRFADAESQAGAEVILENRPKIHARPKLLARQSLTAAQRGTALHMAMQFLDFSRTSSAPEIKAQVEEMAAKKLLSEEAASCVDEKCLYAFFKSALGQRLARSADVNREFKFSILASERAAQDVFALSDIPSKDENTILFQGVIDCYFEEDGKLVLIDFKSDRVSPTTVDAAADSYKNQLIAYKCALSRITGKEVAESYLYFFALDREFPVK